MESVLRPRVRLRVTATAEILIRPNRPRPGPPGDVPRSPLFNGDLFEVCVNARCPGLVALAMNLKVGRIRFGRAWPRVLPPAFGGESNIGNNAEVSTISGCLWLRVSQPFGAPAMLFRITVLAPPSSKVK